MLKVLIIDDEYYFRQALKIKIAWEEMGFKICAEARNGQEALEKMEEFLPDIALVDINMPIMDGLEFVEKIREKGSNVKIIILSGYSEFAYAKQAISMGVQNYLLKPLNANELKDEVNKLKKIIESEHNIKLEINTLKKQIKDNFPMLKEKLLNDLILEKASWGMEDILKRIEYLGMDFIRSSSNIGVILIDIDSNKDVKWSEQDKDLWRFAVKNVAEEMLSLEFELETCFDTDGRICILLGSCNSQHIELDIKLLEVCERIREFIQMHLNFTISIGVGNFYKDMNGIEISYREAVLALKNKLTMGINTVINYNSIFETGLKISLYPVNQRSQLLMNMRICDVQGVNLQIGRLFDTFKQNKMGHELILSTCIELVSTCFEFVAEAGINSEDIYGSLSNIFYEIQSKTTIEELEDWIMGIFATVINLYSKKKNTKNTKIIADIKTYLEENFFDFELNAESLSKKMYMNYSYMSNIFKKETGATINEFVTEIKIKKAKDLLDNGERLITEVAEKVGYEDPNYFSRCFKKFYGMTPSKYIEGLKK